MSLGYLPEHAPNALLDVLVFAEKMEWVADAAAFIGVRKLSNLLVHEYMADAELFLESLQAADNATRMLMEVVGTIERKAAALNLATVMVKGNP